jgi:cytochrome P450
MTHAPARADAPYDPLDPGHHADPARRLAEARDRCPVSEPHPGIFVIAMLDPPEHTALRARLRRWFTPARLRAQEPHIRQIVAGLLDGLAPGQHVEAFTALTRPVPARTVYVLLGLPEQDWDQVQGWAGVIHDHLPQIPPGLPEHDALIGYLAALAAARGAAPATGRDVPRRDALRAAVLGL